MSLTFRGEVATSIDIADLPATTAAVGEKQRSRTAMDGATGLVVRYSAPSQTSRTSGGTLLPSTASDS